MFFSNILNLKNLPSGPIFSRVLRIHDRYVFRGKVSDQTILILLLLSFPSQCLLVFCLYISRAETMDMEHQSQSFCSYTKYLPEDSCRPQHADILGLCHTSFL